jgi:protein-S-isoprenylcysteine O-methyltransferase Ste14
MRTLLVRSTIAFLALPGTVAFAVPLVMIAPGEGDSFADARALVPLGLGLMLLLWAVRDFYVIGRGTLAPWAPPDGLVRTGVYGISRNPMYVAVTLILGGWAWGFRSLALLVYAAVVATAFHIRVVAFEEPRLARAHGRAWLQYRAAVPRWIGWRRQVPAGCSGLAPGEGDR